MPVATPQADLTDGFLASIGAAIPQAAPQVDSPAPADIVDASEVDAIEKASKLNSRIGHTFAKLRASEKEARAKLVEMEARIGTETGAARDALQRQIEEKETMIKDLEERLGRVNLEASPAFQSKFDNRIKAIEGRLAKNLSQFAQVGDDKAAEAASALLKATPEALNERLSKLPPAVAGAVLNSWQDAHDVATERASALAEWRKTLTAVELEDRQTRTQGDIKQRRDVALKAIEDAAGTGCFVYSDIGTPESKEAVTKYREAFLGFVQTADHGELIRKAADGFAAPTLYRVIDLQKDRIRQLETELASRNGASVLPVSPSMGTPPPRVPAPKPGEGMSATELRDTAAKNAAMALRVV